MNKQKNIVHGSFRKGFIARIWNRYRLWNQRRLAVLELHAMPDALLRDLGIERYQISDAVNQSGAFLELPKSPSNKEVAAPKHKAAA